jgi:dynein intermediate chain
VQTAEIAIEVTGPSEDEIQQRIHREVEAERVARDQELEEEAKKLDKELEEEIRGRFRGRTPLPSSTLAHILQK